MKTEMENRLNYYAFKEDNWELHLEGGFWNCQGKHIAVVACITKGIDWAAYIGTDESYKEDDTLEYVAEKGCKLSEKDARYFFPDIKLPYRN